MSLISKIQSLISSANSVTGESRTDLTACVQDLKDGYGGGDLDFDGGSIIVKSFIVTIGANNCTTITECGAYIASLCNLGNDYRLSVIAIEKKDSYIFRELGNFIGYSPSPYAADMTSDQKRRNSSNTAWDNTSYNPAYGAYVVEGTKYLVVLTKEVT